MQILIIINCISLSQERLFLLIRRKYKNMDGQKRSDVKIGAMVLIIQKQHQRTGELTEGIVKNILTNSSVHPHGIKVRLESGEVGRIKEIVEE